MYPVMEKVFMDWLWKVLSLSVLHTFAYTNVRIIAKCSFVFDLVSTETPLGRW